MANWLSTKSVAEKYGIPKEQIREWIRLRYLTCSSIGTEPYEDNDPLIDTEELDKALEFNSLKSYPDDTMMERVRKEHLNWLYQEKARLEKVNDDLLEVKRLYRVLVLDLLLLQHFFQCSLVFITRCLCRSRRCGSKQHCYTHHN